MIRPAKPQDAEAIVRLGIEALRTERFPTLRVSPPRMLEMARECISCPQHFAWVTEEDGEIVAAVLAMTVAGFWFERSEAQVVMFYTQARGRGLPLLRALMRWYRARPILKRLTIVCEYDVDEKTEWLLQRLGLTKGCPVYMNIKGENE